MYVACLMTRFYQVKSCSASKKHRYELALDRLPQPLQEEIDSPWGLIQPGHPIDPRTGCWQVPTGQRPTHRGARVRPVPPVVRLHDQLWRPKHGAADRAIERSARKSAKQSGPPEAVDVGNLRMLVLCCALWGEKKEKHLLTY